MFASSGEVAASLTGEPAKLSRPLDFLVVADHSDNMGFIPDLFAGKPELLVAALKHPIGANLDRYQIIKGWRMPRASCMSESTTWPFPAGARSTRTAA